MKNRIALFGVMVAVGALVAPLTGQKQTNTLWPGTALFRDAVTDGVTDDGNGIYVDSTLSGGQAGVTCAVVPPGLQTAGDFTFYFSSKSRRSIHYAAQAGSVDVNPSTGAPYPGFAQFFDKGSIRVKDILSVTQVSGPGERTVILTAGVTGQFVGDDNSKEMGLTNAVVDNALVTRTGTCAWVINVDPRTSLDNTIQFEGHLARWTGSGWTNYAGTFAMPFQLTVSTTTCQ